MTSAGETARTSGMAPDRAAKWLGGLALTLVIVPAVLRCVTLTVPDLYFSEDPLVLPLQLDALGPAGSMVLNGLSVAGLALALWAHWREKGWVDVWMMLALAGPAGVLVWHGFREGATLDERVAGSHWIAAVATLAGAAHLASLRSVRVGRGLMVGAFFGLVAPLAVKAIYQVTVEHAATVESFQANKEAILAGRGWVADSVQARLFENRLMQREAVGWCSISNVFATLAAGISVFWLCMLLAVARSKLAGGWIGLAALIAGSGMAAVAVTGSRGGIGALLIGAGLSLGILLPKPWRRRVSARAFRVACGLFALASVAVAARGWLLGPEFTADGYSLLFRWYYWVGAARSIGAHLLGGIGADGFQQAYMMLKPALSPEQPALPHSVFLTWVTAMGVWGTAWIAMTLAAVRRAGPTAVGGRKQESTENTVHYRRYIWPAVCLGAVVLALGHAINGTAVLPDFRWLFWPLSMAGFAGLVALVPRLVAETSWWAVRWAAWAAIVVMVLHAQIELTLNDPGPAAAIFMVMGAVAGTADRKGGGGRGAGRAVVGLSSVAAIGFFVLLVIPVVREQRHLHRAAVQLNRCADYRMTVNELAEPLSGGERIAVLRGIASTLTSLGVESGIDGLALQAGTLSSGASEEAVRSFWTEVARQLAAADDAVQARVIADAMPNLEAALSIMPVDERSARDILNYRGMLLHLAAKRSDTEAIQTCADSIVSSSEDLARRWPGNSTTLMAAATHLHDVSEIIRVQAAGSEGRADELRERSLELLERICTLDPYSVEPALLLAETADDMADRERAARWYQETLDLNEGLRLDPARQLPDTTVRRINAAITRLTNEQ